MTAAAIIAMAAGSAGLAGLASMVVGPVEFRAPIWLWLIPILGALSVWIGRSSLSGLGTFSRRAALVVRLIVIVLLACAVAEPQWRRVSKDLAVTVVMDVSRSVPAPLQEWAGAQVQRMASEHKGKDDRLGSVTAAENAYVQALPSKLAQGVERQFIGATAGTNIGSALLLALAVRPEDAAYRVVLVTDGNETVGSVLAAAEAARAAGVPIDVVPLRYAFESEVEMQQILAPATARMGENVNVRVVMGATRPTTGRLSVLLNGHPVDLDPGTEGLSMPVALARGQNFFDLPMRLPRAGPQEFRAIFEPDRPGDDMIVENNEQLAVTFVSGEGRVLVIADSPDDYTALVGALTESRIATEVVTAEAAPASLTALIAYDAIIMIDQPAYGMSLDMQDNLRRFVHDAGGGLIMMGGPNAFGAGGWIGSPLADALPIKLDPPSKREMPRGALVLVMHSIEMPQGVYWGKEVATKAVDALSRLDLAGIVEYAGGPNEATWVHPLSEVGDRVAIRRSIQKLQFGDMPSFDPSLDLALKGLSDVNAGVKHVIVVSDGDPSLSSRFIQLYRRARITVSTVGVFPHSRGDLGKMRALAEGTGGRFYEIIDEGGLANIVQIFIKEAQTVKRPLIWEGDPFAPAITGAFVETMRGVTAVPPITGYVVTAPREGPYVITLTGKEGDPILAQGQYGLGRSIAYTSDAAARWGRFWVGWEQFRAFWEQHLRWAMRPSGSANVRVTTEQVEGRTRLVARALDQEGERLFFARFAARIARPDGTTVDLQLREVGNGEYEGFFESELPGSYVISMRYAAPGPGGGAPIEGSVQAAVTRPFADEFRALKTNESLLRQVAAVTGGRVLTGDASVDNPWRREGAVMPVATRPIWLLFALVGVGVFLLDVAVRRVRVDVAAIARSVNRAVRSGRAAAGQQIGSLRAAREHARARMADRVKGVSVERAQEAERTAAAVKFEVEAAELARRARAKSSPVEQDPAPVTERTPPEREKPARPGPPADQGLSRLKEAKRRARGEMDG